MTFQVTETAAARLPRQRRQYRSTKVVHVVVDPRVWATARRLAEGDMRRVEIVDATTVVVHNHPRNTRKALS